MLLSEWQAATELAEAVDEFVFATAVASTDRPEYSTESNHQLLYKISGQSLCCCFLSCDSWFECVFTRHCSCSFDSDLCCRGNCMVHIAIGKLRFGF